jgi:DNA (cytosine-5)-methyltransferase 1
MAHERGVFVDLFAGCGGLSLGLMIAGWRGLLAVEKSPLAFLTLKHNLIDAKGSRSGLAHDWPDWFPKAPCSIQRFLSEYRADLMRLQGKVDLIAGGPPCQGFSFAGKRRREDRRNALVEKFYIKVVRLIKPKLVLLENVKGIAIEFGKRRRNGAKSRRGRPAKSYAERIKDDLVKAGYEVHADSVKAVEFGVAQLRSRYLLVGIRRELIPEGLKLDPFGIIKELRVPFLLAKGLPTNRPICVREAISDLHTKRRVLIKCEDAPGSKQVRYLRPLTQYQRLLHGSLNGTEPNSLRLANHRPKTAKRFSKMLNKCRRGVVLSPKEKKSIGMNKHTIVVLHPEKPSHTLTTLPDDLLHYSEPRILSVRECARLQAFPDWFEFQGKYTTGGPFRKREVPRYTQVGNAVPPFLAEVVGLALERLRNLLVYR